MGTSNVTTTATVPGPLEGLRVLDLTTVIMGPYATAQLGDLGADVIKIEDPSGDMARRIGARRHDGMTGIMLNLHRNKRSVCLDLKDEQGRQAFTALVRTADAVITNLRPSARERLGLTYEHLKEIKPDIVFCTAQAYRTGSHCEDDPAYDDIVQAASGIPGLFERATGEPGYAPFVVADKVCGSTIASYAIAGLLQKVRTGIGTWIDIPMVDTMVTFNLVEHLNAHTFVPPLREFGWHRVLTANRRPQRASDGAVCILPYSDQNWTDLFGFIGRPELAADERYRSIDHRHSNMGSLLALLEDHAPQHSTAQWEEFCRKHGIPFTPVNDLEDVSANPYFSDDGLITVQQHPSEGPYLSVQSPGRIFGRARVVRRFAPRLGEHTREVLSETELDEEIIAAVAGGQVQ